MFKGSIGKISFENDQKVEWTIEKISSLLTEKDVYYNSPDFNILGMEWFIQIFLNGQGNNTEWISLCFVRHRPGQSKSPVGVTFSFGLKDIDGSVEQILSEHVFEDKIEYRYDKFLSKSVLEEKRIEWAPSGALTLTCSFLTEKDINYSKGLNTLSQDFAELFISKRGCDATLVVKGEKFPVHRFVLSARSSVFASMFDTDMKEKETGTVDIEDCDPGAFREFLLYLYSGKIEKLPINPAELYKIADKYHVTDLKRYCFMVIMDNMSVENFVDAVIFAHQFSMKFMKRKIQEFFNEHFPKILQTDQWNELMNENMPVASALLKSMAKEMETKN